METGGDAVAESELQGFNFGPAIHARGGGIPRAGASVEVLHGDGVVGVPDDDGEAEEFVGFAQFLAGPHHGGDFDEGNDRALDDVFQRAVGLDAHGVEFALVGLDLDFLRHKSVEDFLGVGDEAVIGDEVGYKVSHGAADIAEDEVDDAAGRRREPHDAQLVVDENGADAGAGQQVVHVVVDLREAEYFGLEFGVDRAELLVDRLQFLLGGLEFLVGRLQLLVDRLHLLVGRLEFLGGALKLFVGAAQVFLLGLQFALQRDEAGLGAAAGAGGLFGHRRRLPEDDHEERRLAAFVRADRANGEIGFDRLSVAGDTHARDMNGGGAFGCLAQRGGQRGAQSFAGHFEDVAHAGFAGGRFEVEAGASVEVENVAALVDQRADQRGVGEEFAFGQFAHGGF